MKISQYSQKSAYVGVFFNKVAGLKPPTQVFFCEYCKIFKNNFFYRPPFRRVTRRGAGGGGRRFSLSLLKDHKKCSDFGKIDPDSVHLLVKFSIQNVILRVSRRKNSKFSPVEPFFLKLFTNFLSKYPSSQKPSLP